MRHRHAVLARSILFVVVAGAALTACSSSDDTAGSALKSADAVGDWAEKDASPPVNLTLTADGTVSGTDGCNQMNGTWKINGSKIEFGPFSATMMACENVDTWLSAASAATVVSDEMTILNESGKEIGTLDKQS